MIMRLARVALVGHVAMMVFGAAGILIAIPNPDLWQGKELAQRVYEFGMQHGGPAQMVAGAMAMAAWGLAVLGRRRLAVFAMLAVSVSLSAELLGTKTGWPFGGYAYLDGLGTKIAGRVPYTIPLSWFSMGLASYCLGAALARRTGLSRGRSLPGLVAGAWLLVAWDLVLDPAMSHRALPVRFWVWFDEGRYFGMPLQNLAGWMGTGFTFMMLSRLLWRSEPHPPSLAFPATYYVANLGFAAAIALGVGVWQPAIIILFAALLPAIAAATSAPPEGWARWGLRHLARAALLPVRSTVRGLEHVPGDGPAVIASRHVHSLYDGALFVASLPRAPVIVVALDWAGHGWQRRGMERLCRAARWPVIERPRPESPDTGSVVAGMREALDLLHDGELVVVFPEGRPVFDPHAGNREDAVLPFQRGAAWLAERAARRCGKAIPVVPAGLTYAKGGPRWDVQVSFGKPIVVQAGDDVGAITRRLEEAVRQLSAPGGTPAVAAAEEELQHAR
jgi:putative membrane protein